jgi:Zn-finger nucleic acid-binding protein
MGSMLHDSVQIDVCRCGGMWFDAGELAAWRAGRAAKPLVCRCQGTTERPCPRCPSQRLLDHTVATIPVLACPGCHGVFVPAASVARLDPRHPAAESGLGFAVIGELLDILGNALFLL